MGDNTSSVIAVVLASAIPASGQVWVYQAYNQSGPTDIGTVSLEKFGDSYYVRKVAGRVSNACDQNSLKATVEEGEGMIVITTVSLVPGCAAERFRIRADGSGGTREFRVGEGEWVLDKRDRRLTLKK